MNPNKYWNWTSQYFISKYYWEGINFPSENDDVSRKIPIAFHNEWSYDYHFIIKRLAEELKKKKQFHCLEKNTDKYIAFTVPIEREVTRIDKNWEKLQRICLTYYNLLIKVYGKVMHKVYGKLIIKSCE